MNFFPWKSTHFWTHEVCHVPGGGRIIEETLLHVLCLMVILEKDSAKSLGNMFF